MNGSPGTVDQQVQDEIEEHIETKSKICNQTASKHDTLLTRIEVKYSYA